MRTRPANTNDIPVLVELRKKLLLEEGLPPDADIDAPLALGEYFTAAMADGSLAAWVAEEEGEVAATGAVCFFTLPPTFSNPAGRVAYITNMYTRKEYRRKGIATGILDIAIAEAKARGCGRIQLHASEDGKSIYRRAGFVDYDSYMVLMNMEREDFPWPKRKKRSCLSRPK